MHTLALIRRRARCTFLIFAATLGTALAGCVDTSIPEVLSKQQFCERLAAVDCKGYWTCWTSDEREAKRAALLANGQDIGLSQRACSMNLKALCPTNPITCDEGSTFQEMKAGVCVDSVEAQSCEEWSLDGIMGVGCDKVCSPTVSGG